VQAVTRAFNILREIASSSDGRSFAEIAAATGLPLATCHRSLRGLVDSGLVTRDATMKRFYPGPALVRLAATVWTTSSGQIVDSSLVRLRDRWQECFFLASVVEDSIICTRSASAMDPHRMSVSVPLGQQMNPHAAASCKAILAFRSDGEREALLAAAGGLVRLTDRTIVDIEVLRRELDKIPSRGYAICDQEAEYGVATFAVPVIPGSGPVQSSLGVVGPRDRLFASRDAGLIDDMTEAAAAFAGVASELLAQTR
jgi:IclR family acetate operon transcriptional repressor